MTKQDCPIRCAWAHSEPSILYHDFEWGVPIHDERLLFEFLILEGMQAGLNWITILKKRESFRLSFDNFIPEKVALFDENRIKCLLENPLIIRNKLKIKAAIQNAQAFLKLREESADASRYFWEFVGGKPITNYWKKHENVPSHTEVSDKLSKDLKKRGFSFVGSTICYAFMQAVGMVNDHTTDCFRHREIASRY